MKRRVFLAVLLLVISATCLAQSRPQLDAKQGNIPNTEQTLRGQLIYHDGIRKWFELKLDEPSFGQTSIQLVFSEKYQTNVEVLRGCKVRSRGSINESPTGYYSLDFAQNVSSIEPVGQCVRQKPFPDYTKLKPAKGISGYRVDMLLDLTPGDHPIMFRVTSGKRELRPWQAYASYFLTGGFVLYGMCAESFVVHRVFGDRETMPSHFTTADAPDDKAMFDAENTEGPGKKHLHASYTCVAVR